MAAESSAPDVPGRPVITPGDEQLGVGWSMGQGLNIDHYLVYRHTMGRPGSALISNTSHNWTVDRNLANGVTYTYRVVAVSHSNEESSPSLATHGTPGAVPIVDYGRPFSSMSPWNQTLGPDAPLDPNSRLMMEGIEPSTGQQASGAQGGLMASIAKSGTYLSAFSGYSSPIYVVPRDQPLVPVHVIEPTAIHHVALERVLAKGVPIPPNGQGATGTDGHMTIYQASTDTMWDFWRACSPEGSNNFLPWVAPQTCPIIPASTWTVQTGGVIRHVSQSLGYYDASSYPTASAFHWGATATGLPVAAGMVTMAELRKGTINHALALDIPGYGLPGAACAYYNWKAPDGMGPTPIAWPAQRGDGTSLGPDCIPEGARLRIDPDFDLDSIQLPKVARMFAVAAQKYGMIVRDHDAGGVSFFSEDPVSLRQAGSKINPYTNQPWSNAGASPDPTGLLAGAPVWSLFKKFPWNHVEVLKLTICHAKLTACPSTGN